MRLTELEITPLKLEGFFFDAIINGTVASDTVYNLSKYQRGEIFSMDNLFFSIIKGISDNFFNFTVLQIVLNLNAIVSKIFSFLINFNLSKSIYMVKTSNGIFLFYDNGVINYEKLGIKYYFIYLLKILFFIIKCISHVFAVYLLLIIANKMLKNVEFKTNIVKHKLKEFDLLKKKEYSQLVLAKEQTFFRSKVHFDRKQRMELPKVAAWWVLGRPLLKIFNFFIKFFAPDKLKEILAIANYKIRVTKKICKKLNINFYFYIISYIFYSILEIFSRWYFVLFKLSIILFYSNYQFIPMISAQNIDSEFTNQLLTNNVNDITLKQMHSQITSVLNIYNFNNNLIFRFYLFLTDKDKYNILKNAIKHNHRSNAYLDNNNNNRLNHFEKLLQSRSLIEENRQSLKDFINNKNISEKRIINKDIVASQIVNLIKLSLPNISDYHLRNDIKKLLLQIGNDNKLILEKRNLSLLKSILDKNSIILEKVNVEILDSFDSNTKATNTFNNYYSNFIQISKRFNELSSINSHFEKLIKYLYLTDEEIENIFENTDYLDKYFYKNFLEINQSPDNIRLLFSLSVINENDLFCPYIQKNNKETFEYFSINRINPDRKFTLEINGFNDINNLGKKQILYNGLINSYMISDEKTSTDLEYSYKNIIKPIIKLATGNTNIEDERSFEKFINDDFEKKKEIFIKTNTNPDYSTTRYNISRLYKISYQTKNINFNFNNDEYHQKLKKHVFAVKVFNLLLFFIFLLTKTFGEFMNKNFKQKVSYNSNKFLKIYCYKIREIRKRFILKTGNKNISINSKFFEKKKIILLTDVYNSYKVTEKNINLRKKHFIFFTEFDKSININKLKINNNKNNINKKNNINRNSQFHEFKSMVFYYIKNLKLFITNNIFSFFLYMMLIDYKNKTIIKLFINFILSNIYLMIEIICDYYIRSKNSYLTKKFQVPLFADIFNDLIHINFFTKKTLKKFIKYKIMDNINIKL